VTGILSDYLFNTTLFKAHGMGNDFVVYFDLDNETEAVLDSETGAQIISNICQPGFGISADGLIRIGFKEHQGRKYHFMDYYNADGSQAKMCGNGVRVTARLIEKTLSDETSQVILDDKQLQILTRSGLKYISKYDDDHYQVDMGTFKMKQDKDGLYVDLGNKHFVQEVDKNSTLTLENFFGDKLSSFKKGINYEFVHIAHSRNKINMRVYENGVGETTSCGTGICAAAIYAYTKYKSTQQADYWHVEVPGGVAFVDIKEVETQQHVFLTGPAEVVAQFNLEGDFYKSIKRIEEQFANE
jgi:diaminopimelate epimerase